MPNLINLSVASKGGFLEDLFWVGVVLLLVLVTNNLIKIFKKEALKEVTNETSKVVPQTKIKEEKYKTIKDIREEKVVKKEKTEVEKTKETLGID